MFNLEDVVVTLLSTYHLSDILQAISEEIINQKEEYDQSYADLADVNDKLEEELSDLRREYEMLEHRIDDLEHELRVVRFKTGI